MKTQSTPLVRIIEDSADQQELIAIHLRRVAPKAKQAQSGELASGIDAVRTLQTDLLILDLHLPDGSGLDLLRQFPRAQRQFPILVLTGDKNHDALEQAMRLGADDFLTKPIDHLVFEAKVGSLLSRRYVSPFTFFGDAGGMLAPIEMSFGLQINYLSERHIEAVSRVSIPRGSRMRIRYAGLELPCTIAHCERVAAGIGEYVVTAVIRDEMTLEEQARLRRIVLDRIDAVS